MTEDMPSEPVATVTPDTADDVGRRIELGELNSPLLREAVALWTSKKGVRRFPAREALVPRDMAHFLRYVTLYRVFEDEQDFEYRVMGDAAVQAWGRNFVGFRTKDLNALREGMGDVIARICSSVAKRCEPLAVRGTLSKTDFDLIGQETVFLPLGPDDDTVDHILSVGWYVAQPPGGPSN